MALAVRDSECLGEGMVGGDTINTRIHSPQKCHGTRDSRYHGNSTGDWRTLLLDEFLHVHPYLSIPFSLYLWQGWMTLVYPTRNLPGAPERCKTLASFLLGRSGLACVQKRKWACSLGQRGRKIASDSGESLPTAPLHRAGGWTSKDGWGRKTTLAKPSNISKAYVQIISVSNFNMQLCDVARKKIVGNELKHPVVIPRKTWPWMCMPLKSGPLRIGSLRTMLQEFSPKCQDFSGKRLKVWVHPPGICLTGTGQSICASMLQAWAVNLPFSLGHCCSWFHSRGWAGVLVLAGPSDRPSALSFLPLF